MISQIQYYSISKYTKDINTLDITLNHFQIYQRSLVLSRELSISHNCNKH